MSFGRDALATARLHRQLATAEWDRGNFQVARDHLAASLEILDGSEPWRGPSHAVWSRAYQTAKRGRSETPATAGYD
jgi:hypothetical protein